MPAQRRTLWLAFGDGRAAVEAARRLRGRGYRIRDIHAAYTLPGAAELLDDARPRSLPRLVLVFGLLGAACGYLIQWYTNSVDYPLHVGGRPLHPMPAFVPITFEAGVLAAALAAFFGLLVAARLLRLWQPAFEVPDFVRTTIDRYWIALDAEARGFDLERVVGDACALGALRAEAPEERQ